MYNPQNAKEGGLPSDMIFDGVIVDIKDGLVNQFVKDTTKWKKPNQNAIEISIEIVHNGTSHVFKKLFTYNEENGVTIYAPRGDMGKYKAKYNHLPMVSDKVKVQTDGKGFAKLKLD